MSPAFQTLYQLTVDSFVLVFLLVEWLHEKLAALAVFLICIGFGAALFHSAAKDLARHFRARHRLTHRREAKARQLIPE